MRAITKRQRRFWPSLASETRGQATAGWWDSPAKRGIACPDRMGKMPVSTKARAIFVISFENSYTTGNANGMVRTASAVLMFPTFPGGTPRQATGLSMGPD